MLFTNVTQELITAKKLEKQTEWKSKANIKQG